MKIKYIPYIIIFILLGIILTNNCSNINREKEIISTTIIKDSIIRDSIKYEKQIHHYDTIIKNQNLAKVNNFKRFIDSIKKENIELYKLINQNQDTTIYIIKSTFDNYKNNCLVKDSIYQNIVDVQENTISLKDSIITLKDSLHLRLRKNTAVLMAQQNYLLDANIKLNKKLKRKERYNKLLKGLGIGLAGVIFYKEIKQ